MVSTIKSYNFYSSHFISHSKKLVSEKLKEIGATNIKEAAVSDNNNLILHAQFKNVDYDLEKQIKLIPGVIESGLFYGYNVKVKTND